MAHTLSHTTRAAWQRQAIDDGISEICPACDGQGVIEHNVRGWQIISYACGECDGSGLVPAA